VLTIESGGTTTHPLENALWKRLWTCRKVDYMTMALICSKDTSSAECHRSLYADSGPTNEDSSVSGCRLKKNGAS